jgi:hypothetical protein
MNWRRRLAALLVVLALAGCAQGMTGPYFGGSIWYDKANLWVRGEFARDGSKVQYQLDA